MCEAFLLHEIGGGPRAGESGEHMCGLWCLKLKCNPQLGLLRIWVPLSTHLDVHSQTHTCTHTLPPTLTDAYMNTRILICTPTHPTHMHTPTRTTHTFTYVHTHPPMHTPTHTQCTTHTFTYAHPHMNTLTHAHTRTCTHTHSLACISVG